MAEFSQQQVLDRANSHLQAGQLPEAEALCRQLLAQDPNQASFHHALGLVLARGGKLDAAIAACRQAIELQPDFAEAFLILGVALKQKREFDQAISAYEKAIELQPNNPAAYSNLGVVLIEKEQFPRAIAALQTAIQLRPTDVVALANLAAAFVRRPVGNDDLEQAITLCKQAIGLRPDYAPAYSNLGAALQKQGDLVQAIANFRRAVELQPNDLRTLANLGAVLQRAGDLDQAVATYERAIALNPNDSLALNNLATAEFDRGNLNDAIRYYQRAFDLDPRSATIDSNRLFCLQFHPDYDAKAIYEHATLWNQRHAAELGREIAPHTNERSPDRPLRIGYISPDMRDHVAGQIMYPLFVHHDSRQFHLVAYSDVVAPDLVTDRLRQHSDTWRTIAGMNDAQVAQLIRDDGIDLLIDLTMHMANNRLLVLARKPAPVQITHMAYPGTTGLSAIDYRLSDPYLDPMGMFDRFYLEQTIRLPHTFWCYDPSFIGLQDAPEVSTLPAARNGHITFGCLNSFAKVSDGTLDLWAKTLNAVAGSKMILLVPAGQCRQRVLERFVQKAVWPDRIEFIDRKPRKDYLQVYHRIDLSLDSLPYNGHTTNLDSFWMGVPVVTMVGSTAVGRAGLSQLSNLGLADLAAQTPQQFIQIASDLANDLPKLAEIRRSLRPKMRESPLTDGPAYLRAIEAIYRDVWRKWCIEGVKMR